MKAITLILCTFFTLNAFASNVDPYFELTKKTVTKVETPFEVEYPLEFSGGGLGPVIDIIDQLIALGKKIWPIIEAGKPVVTTDMANSFSVLPFDAEADIDFTQMSHWSMPKTQSYDVVYENGYGMDVVSFTYTVQFQYGGRYNEIGRYLTAVRVIASRVSVKWGFEFNAKTEMANFSNLGSKDAPVAGATVDISYIVKNIFQENRNKDSFFVTGEGVLSRL